ncbi:hypothetical protein BIFDEN_01982 [Bifidobacterium dentium ATCC 27678]|nr:hypothetical protein BIFDEN_01982 [Bifidobacterium dentium ATCC 27678]
MIPSAWSHGRFRYQKEAYGRSRTDDAAATVECSRNNVKA